MRPKSFCKDLSENIQIMLKLMLLWQQFFGVKESALELRSSLLRLQKRTSLQQFKLGAKTVALATKCCQGYGKFPFYCMSLNIHSNLESWTEVVHCVPFSCLRASFACAEIEGLHDVRITNIHLE
ncbi:hypothetical protein KP509_1Z246900 [Ceratopteris richardii]|nr:hypothetical protein KP509_1Z246900 [Ceratopteris richardii]